MLYEDRMAVATPEGVTLEFTLAGVGSRFVAAMIDGLLQFAAVVGVVLLNIPMSSLIGGFSTAFMVGAVFVILFGYDVASETLASGRTLGKRWTGLRVVRIGGAPVTFVPSAVRNLLRLVDLLPGWYLAGVIFILATSKNQRLGDLAAGTIVVRERVVAPTRTQSWSGWSPPVAPAEVGTWDVSQVTADEVATVREFLSRRSSISSEARSRIARDLAGKLRPKVVGPADGIGPETFLERVIAAKSARE
jgi:uncharacterized RDD family membrane protein YckC